MAKAKKTGKKKIRKSIPVGEAYIQSSFNNTIITITDPQGNVSPGRAEALLDSKAQERAHLLLPSLQRKMQQRRHWKTA